MIRCFFLKHLRKSDFFERLRTKWGYLWTIWYLMLGKRENKGWEKFIISIEKSKGKHWDIERRNDK